LPACRSLGDHSTHYRTFYAIPWYVQALERAPFRDKIKSVQQTAIVPFGLYLLAVLHLPAQETAKPRRQFEVASIKPNISGPPRVYKEPFALSPEGRLTATNVTLVDVIVRVYPTRRIQMQGGPYWIDSDRFDIVAKADTSDQPLEPGQWQTMVQAMVEDRFRLRYHRETQEKQVYALTVANEAPKLEPSKDGEVTSLIPGEHGQMIFRKMSIAGLVNTMANILHTPVVDRSGIDGFFDFTLDPDRFAAQEGDETPFRREEFGERVITAVREQLGLKLERQKAPLEITIIDHAERPIDN
jgi:uncharacterized protein (TIGR03435 family)